MAGSPIGVLDRFLFETQGFLTTLWLFEDNSVDTDLGFLFYHVDAIPTASSNSIDVSTTTANGSHAELILRGWPEMSRVVSVGCDSVLLADNDGARHVD